jgi:sugar phosphate isomerase/epimerase
VNFGREGVVQQTSVAASERQNLSPADWPIAAAMIPFNGAAPADVPPAELHPDTWRRPLAQVAHAGFREVDLTDSWVKVAELTPAQREDVRGTLAELNLTVPAISTARCSVIDPRHAADNLAYSHRVIDTAPEFGATVVSFGLFEALTEQQKQVLWFWTVPGATNDPDDADLRRACVSAFQELADHASEVGVQLTLEMYEDNYLGTADSSVRLVEDIGRNNVGLNPDLGNLVRAQGPIEPWQQIMTATVPYMNYWHVKNYFRMEDPLRGTVFTTPAPLDAGFVDYRKAVAQAVQSGFRGAFLVEHYGGDGLWQSARSRDYLRHLLEAAQL